MCHRNEVIPTALDAAIDIRNTTILKRLLKSAYEVDMEHQNCPAAYKSALRSASLQSGNQAEEVRAVIEDSRFGGRKGRQIPPLLYP